MEPFLAWSLILIPSLVLVVGTLFWWRHPKDVRELFSGPPSRFDDFVDSRG